MRLCVIASLAMVLVAAGMCSAQVYTDVWEIEDGTDTTYAWEDLSIGSYWEWMYSGAIGSGETVCTISDLPSPYLPTQALYAVSPTEVRDYSGCDFWAILYLDNNWAGFNEPVTVTLGTGTAGIPASFTAVAGPVTVFVTTSGNINCGVPYTFNFGTVPNCILSNTSLILAITNADTGGNTHIYWDALCCPSALYAYCPGSAVEPQGWGSIKALYR